MNEAYESIRQWTGLTTPAQSRIVQTLIVILVLMVLREVAIRVLARWSTEARVHYTWRKFISYSFAIIALIAVARIWFAWFENFGTFLGLASAGLAIALRDPIVNLVGWFFIVSRRPFSVGDRIQIGDTAGDVVDQRIFSFSLLEIGNWVQADQSTGRIVHVPNGLVFTQPQFNYTRGVSYIWNELRVTLTFDSDWRKAKRLLQEIVDRHGETVGDEARQRMVEAGRRYLIVYSHLTPIVYTDLRENGVLLTMRYLCDPRRRRGSSHSIWEDVLDAFAGEEDLAFAYPTTRFVEGAEEGKIALRPPPPLPDAV